MCGYFTGVFSLDVKWLHHFWTWVTWGQCGRVEKRTVIKWAKTWISRMRRPGWPFWWAYWSGKMVTNQEVQYKSYSVIKENTSLIYLLWEEAVARQGFCSFFCLFLPPTCLSPEAQRNKLLPGNMNQLSTAGCRSALKDLEEPSPKYGRITCRILG